MASDSGELQRLIADLNMAPIVAKKLVSAHVRKTGLLIVRESKKIVPYKTGNLMRSIGMTNGLYRVTVGPLAHYGAHVEYGTVKQKAQPYMMPAANMAEPQFLKGMQDIADKIRGDLT